jgi:protocatechuate 3,4-dioxygenase beta subunit
MGMPASTAHQRNPLPPRVAGESYLRGVQETDADGKVTFTTLFPGCYAGRWPHIHFEIYPSLASATNGSNKIATSQLAFAEEVCDEAHTATGYSKSITNLAGVSLAGDNVLSDGSDLQVAKTSGAPSAGYAATLTVAIDT